MLSEAARQLTPAEGAVQVPALIVSGDELVVGEPWALADLISGVARFHLPRHADQLRSLR
jgi:hypothetical protein